MPAWPEVYGCLTQYREGDSEQEDGHPSQHRYEQVADHEDGQHGRCRVVPTETADGSLVLGGPDEAQEQQGDHHCPDKQLEGLEVPGDRRSSWGKES